MRRSLACFFHVLTPLPVVANMEVIMTTPKKTRPKKPKNEPIELSGRVFTSKLLALELRGTGLPDVLRHGDVKLLAVPKGHGYAGFVTATVYHLDEKRWRKLALRGGAAVEAIYKGPVERVSRARAAIELVCSLRGRSAIWRDSTYWVEASTSQQSAQPAVTTTGAEQEKRTAVTAVPATPAGGANSSHVDVQGKTAVEPVGKKGEQLCLF